LSVIKSSRKPSTKPMVEMTVDDDIFQIPENSPREPSSELARVITPVPGPNSEGNPGGSRVITSVVDTGLVEVNSERSRVITPEPAAKEYQNNLGGGHSLTLNDLAGQPNQLWSFPRTSCEVYRGVCVYQEEVKEMRWKLLWLL
jgi:hypothetical protein